MTKVFICQDDLSVSVLKNFTKTNSLASFPSNQNHSDVTGQV